MASYLNVYLCIQIRCHNHLNLFRLNVVHAFYLIFVFVYFLFLSFFFSLHFCGGCWCCCCSSTITLESSSIDWCARLRFLCVCACVSVSWSSRTCDLHFFFSMKFGFSSFCNIFNYAIRIRTLDISCNFL